jgi:H+/Cl- antiporter ClcA
MAQMMATLRPAAKVTAATFAAAFGTLLVWILNTFFLSPAHQISDPVHGAITTLLVGLAGYFTPPSMRDQVVETASAPDATA